MFFASLVGCSDTNNSAEEATQQANADVNSSLSDLLGCESQREPEVADESVESIAGIAAMTQFGLESMATWDDAALVGFCADGATGVTAFASFLHDRFPDYSLSDAREATRQIRSVGC